MFKGTLTALVTPFRNRLVDTTAFERLIEGQIDAGIDGIVPVGTTGESPTLSHDEHIRVIELAVRRAKGKTKVLAGTGSNSTQEAIELTQEAEQVGADGVLLVAPYYNRPTQEGLFAHYAAVAEATDLPIILYSIPGRCGVEIAVDTVVRLAEARSNIIGIKEAGGSIERFSQLRMALPETFLILSGDDSMTLPAMAVGACGVISVASNGAPKRVKKLVSLALAGRFDAALKEHLELYPLFKDLFLESNPAPVKAWLASQGWMTDEVRLPLVPMSESNRARLLALTARLNLE
ncbi:MAG: 4-hydroxy-tetrahydrodipicolinate synthase [Candidatus Methylacidiphilales bacterium]